MNMQIHEEMKNISDSLREIQRSSKDLLEMFKTLRLSLNNPASYKNSQNLSKHTKRQAHGFIYEDAFMKKFDIKPSKKYTAEFDGQCEYPVQVKFTKMKGEVCLGSYRRNAKKSKDFVLHMAFYREKYKPCEEHTLLIDHSIYTKLFKADIDLAEKELSVMTKKQSDDIKHKELLAKYKKYDDIVHIRFKRDHKGQKRIQAAIPRKMFPRFVRLFKPFKFKSSAPSILGTLSDSDMLSRSNRKKLEKFYTNDDVVEMCVKHALSVAEKLGIDTQHILEPSAGNGAFTKKFGAITYDAYDILPESKDIVKANFLTKPIDEIVSHKDKTLIVIGNPPYKLAIKFINRCAELKAALICFVLPNVFKKPTTLNKIHMSYHLHDMIPLAKNAFMLGDEKYDVPSSFFVFERKKTLRSLVELNMKCDGYKYVKFSAVSVNDDVVSGADLIVLRVGGRAGKAFLASDTSEDASVSKQKYNYFIKLDAEHKDANGIVREINKIKWEVDNTTGPRSIGKYELTPILNDIINQVHQNATNQV